VSAEVDQADASPLVREQLQTVTREMSVSIGQIGVQPPASTRDILLGIVRSITVSTAPDLSGGRPGLSVFSGMVCRMPRRRRYSRQRSLLYALSPATLPGFARGLPGSVLGTRIFSILAAPAIRRRARGWKHASVRQHLHRTPKYLAGSTIATGRKRSNGT
jgi:hypothetical protein